MSTPRHVLNSKTIVVLEMIAAGNSYEQILSAHPSFTYLDIFDAARQALDFSVVAQSTSAPAYKVSEIRDRYPRAYEPWSEADDGQLLQYIKAGLTVAQIAGRLQRKRSAIRNRISKRNLITELSPKEQARLHRISALDPRGDDKG